MTAQGLQAADVPPTAVHFVDDTAAMVATTGATAAVQSTRMGAPILNSLSATTVTVEEVQVAHNLNRFHQAARNLFETGQNNIRILRGWAKSKGWIKEPNPKTLGRPERWGTMQDGQFQWHLRIKPEASNRVGLDAGRNTPRFDARLDIGGEKYINPYANIIGNQEVGTHLLLEKSYY